MTYVPERGDLVWMDFNPQSGHEQAGHRPGLVLSPSKYNRRGLMLVCPVTSRPKNSPLAIPVATRKVNGYVLADHMKSQDWQARRVTFAEKAPPEVLQQTLRVIALLLTGD